MSFMYNPYLHIEVIETNKTYQLLCCSCGGVIPLDSTMLLPELFNRQARHIRYSHKLEPDDFKGWGIE